MLLALLPAGAGVGITRWEKPVIESVLLPAHAQTTDDSLGNVSDATTAVDPQFEVRFEGATTVDGVTLVIVGGLECYRFGIRETADPQGWEELYHQTSPSGVMLDLTNNPGNVVLGSTTLFGSGVANGLTYLVRGCDSGRCWVWGHDPSTFASEGCTILA